MCEYYPLNIIIDGKDHYCIWFIDQTTGFVTECNRINAYSSLEKLKAYAGQKEIKLCNEESANGEGVVILYPEGDAPAFDNSQGCRYYINVWNTADDIAVTLDKPFSGKSGDNSIDDIYDKLFWACNLPAVTPEGKEYIPIWSKEEMELLKKIIDDAIKIIINTLYPVI